MNQQVFRIGRCWLTQHDPDPDESNHRYPPGYWQPATCAEYRGAIRAAGGYEALTVWSGFTNMEWSDLGEPFMFTEWGHRDDALGPVAATGGPPDHQHPCALEHAVFRPTPTSTPEPTNERNQP